MEKEPLSILVVDDDYLNRVVITGLLKKLGFTPEVADSGTKALEFFKARKFDLILMDCHMPTPDGYTTTRDIRASEELRTRVRIVGVSASIIMGDISLCLAAGMDWAVAKPLSLSTLSEIIRSCNRSGPPTSPFKPPFFHSGTFDHQRFLSRFQGMEDLIEELVSAFQLTYPDLLNHVRAAIQKRDGAALELSAHTLSGVLANFYTSSQSLALRLEKMGIEKTFGDADSCLAELAKQIELLSRELSSFLVERNAA